MESYTLVALTYRILINWAINNLGLFFGFIKKISINDQFFKDNKTNYYLSRIWHNGKILGIQN